jgi:hypothetical protein
MSDNAASRIAKFLHEWSLMQGNDGETIFWLQPGVEGREVMLMASDLRELGATIASQAANIERLRGNLDHAVSMLEGIHVPLGYWDDIKELRATLQPKEDAA